uniref:TLDc domain-containing protein n=1 Tax=Araucaria cunninghamii TaxID=56994 RepID=A0A0D6R5F1_ARACU
MLGWKDKLADKLSTFLSDSSKYSPIPLDLDPCAVPSEPQGSSAIVAEGDFYGPDTSSLSAFLFSLLPAADTGSNGNIRSQNVENEASSSSDLGISTGEKRQNENSFKKDEFLECKTHCRREEEPRVYEDDNEWEFVTESGSKTSDTSDHYWVSQKPVPSLPDLSDDSSFLSVDLREFVNASLPTVVKGCQWVLLYSTQKHGISLLTLIRKSADLPGPCLLVTGDMQGAVFGGLVNGPLKPTPKKKYQGTNQSFVFTTIYGEPRLFRPTGANRYFILCMNDMLALGGGGNFALCLDGDLLNGTSGPCDTFGNSCLAYSPEFSLKNVELWGFAHLSKYLP